MTRENTVLINVQAPLYASGGTLYADEQACNGLRRWADNFDHATALFPVIEGEPPKNCVPLHPEIQDYSDKIRIEQLPWAYRPDQFLRHLPSIKRKITALINQSQYLNFAIGNCLFGDWGAVACRLAARLERPYSVWTDRVESQVVRSDIGHVHWRKSIQARLFHRTMAALEKSIVQRSALGLFHGRETYDAYAPYCSNPHLVHNIHISAQDHLPPADVIAKQKACLTGPLEICYVGRIDLMKGPYDWVSVTEALQARGIDFKAVWLGSGTEEDALRARVAKSGLQDQVRLPGFFSDRAVLLDELRRSHLMLFCHKTPESPRCLIEALVSATAIVGYDGAYPRDLTAAEGGALLTPLNDVSALADAVASLAKDREHLAQLIGQASKAGANFDDISIFRHRCDLIKSHL